MTHRKTTLAYAATAAASSLALVVVAGGSAAADHDPSTSWTGSCAAVQDLQVAPEVESGYDRDKFGDYDRDALLAASEKKHGDNYYSRYDNVHYYFDDYGGKEQADDEIDVDHAVALSEAWDSGAGEWSAAKRDQFAGDTANLTLLTDDVNQGAKSDNDIAEWVPPYDGAIGGYVTRWVNVKSTYGLSVDQAELDALLALTGCSGDAPPADKGNQDDSGNKDGNDDASGDEDANGGDETSDATGDEDNLAPVPTPAEAHIEVTG